MAMVGAAVDDLQHLAKLLGTTGHRLCDIRAGLDHQVQGTRWTGPDGARFGHEWTSTYGPRLATVGEALERLAVILQQQARDQATASKADGTAGAGRSTDVASAAIGGTAVGVAAIASSLLSWAAKAAGPIGVPSTVKTLGDVVTGGDYDDLIHLGGDALRERLPELTDGALHDSLHGLGTVLDRVGVVTGLIIAGDDTSKLIENVGQEGWSDESKFKLADVAGDLLKSAPGKLTVVGYLGGVAVKQWTDVAREAEKIDFTQPMPPLTPDNIANIYLPGAGDGLVTGLKMTLGNIF